MGSKLSKSKSNRSTMAGSGEPAESPRNDTLPEGAKYIENGPTRTPMFISTMPSRVKQAKTIELKHETCCLWNATSLDTIMMGGYAVNRGDHWPTPTVSVVDDRYNIITNKLDMKGTVTSGVCVNTELAIVQIYQDIPDKIGPWKSAKPATVCTIKTNFSIPSTMSPCGTFEVLDIPFDVFRFSKNKFGILCDKQIKVYTLIDILIETSIKPAQDIYLDLPDLQYNDRARVTPDSDLCVSSEQNGQIYVFNTLGERKQTIGKDILSYPRSVQFGADGKIIVGGVSGYVHLYNGQYWVLLKGHESALTRQVLVSESRLWTLTVWENLSYHERRK